MRTSSRRRSRAGLSVPEITLTPLIDTALTLLIIFMVTTPMIHNAIKVNLPHGRVKEDVGATQDLVVYIDKDEELYINGQKIIGQQINGQQTKYENFLKELQRMIGRQEDKMVYVKADRSVSYGMVLETVDIMKRIEGIAHVAMATQRA